MAGIKYKLYKKPHATDDFYEWGEYDPTEQSELEAMLRSVFDFGRYMYSDFKIERVGEEMREEGQTFRHEVKILPEFFNAIQDREKNFELRRDDRGYQVGDILEMREYEDGAYTGRKLALKIRYILRNCPEHGLMEGYCIIGF